MSSSWLDDIAVATVSPDYGRLSVQLRRKLKHLLDTRNTTDICSATITSDVDYASAWHDQTRTIYLNETLIPARHRPGAAMMMVDNNTQLSHYARELYCHFLSQAAHAKHSRWVYNSGPFNITKTQAFVVTCLENIRSEMRLAESCDAELEVREWFRKAMDVLMSPPDSLDDKMMNVWVVINGFGRAFCAKKDEESTLHEYPVEKNLISASEIQQSLGAFVDYLDDTNTRFDFIRQMERLGNIQDYDYEQMFDVAEQIIKILEIPEDAFEDQVGDDQEGSVGQMASEMIDSSEIDDAASDLDDMEAQAGSETAQSAIDRLRQQAMDSASGEDGDGEATAADDLWDPDNPPEEKAGGDGKEVPRIKSSDKRISEWNRKIRDRMKRLADDLKRKDFDDIVKKTREAEAAEKEFKDTKNKEKEKALNNDQVEDITHGNSDEITKDGFGGFGYKDVSSAMRTASMLIKESLDQASTIFSDYNPMERDYPFGSEITSQMMLSEAEEELGMPASPKPWEVGIFEDDESPTIKAGVILDITASMGFAQDSLAQLSWCLNNALRSMDNAHAVTALFGRGVFLTQNSRSSVHNNLRYPIWEGSCSSHQYALAAQCLDSTLELTEQPDDNEVKMVFVVSDGQYGSQEITLATAENKWLEMSDVEVFWIYYNGGSMYTDSALNFDNREICYLELHDIEASAKELCRRIDERIGRLIKDKKVYR